MAAAKPAHQPIKVQSLGTRVGKLLNKLDKIESQRAAALVDAPTKIDAKFDEKKARALADADDDVIEKLGLEK